MIMLDILTIVHSFADTQTASRIRQTCRRLSALTPVPVLYSNKRGDFIKYTYRIDGKLHRLDGPAMETMVGYKSWYRGGVAHREYHPHCIRGYYRDYMVEGVYHREVYPSTISGTGVTWYLRGKPHRKIGPAKTRIKIAWYTLGKLHRLDGPVYDGIYAIRGIEHSISVPMETRWMIDNKIIRE